MGGVVRASAVLKWVRREYPAETCTANSFGGCEEHYCP